MAAEVGAGYVSIYPDTSSFKSEISKALEGDFSTSGQKASKGFFSAFDIGLGTFLGNMGTNLFGSMMGNMATAMNRLDTLTNYPKVMEGFGYSAEQAEESIELIMDRLVGLPTTTQEMVQFTQALADSTGDLDLATRGALAFNDAMLASGAPMADQTRAQRIFNRIVGSGTTTTQQWAAIMSVMPLQLGMTARALLGTSATAQDLGAALMNGQVSIEDILRAMVRLDEEGGEGMASFNEQAWNMAFTLETALKLIPIRISNALAAIGQELGRDNLMAPFLAIANGIKALGEQIIAGIQWVKANFAPQIAAISGLAQQAGELLTTVLGMALQSIGTILAELAPAVIHFVQGALVIFNAALQFLADHGEVVSGILRGLALAFGIMFVQANPLIAIVGVITMIIGAIYDWVTTTEEGRAAWENFCAIVGSIFQVVGDTLTGIFNAVVDVIKGAVDFIVNIPQAISQAWNKTQKDASKAWKNITKVISDAWKALQNLAKTVFTAIAGGILGIIGGLAGSLGTAWNGIKDTASTAWNNIKTLAGTAWNGIKSTITGIVDGAKTALGTAWENMKSTASTAWNNIKSTASTVWGNIKTTIGNLVDGIKNGAKGAWETMTSTAKGAWETMKSNASTIFGGIQSTLGGIWDKITGKTSSSVTSMQNSINSLKGKSVTVGVAKAGGFDGVIRSAQSAINSIQGRTVGINLNVYKTGISGLAVEQSYSGLGVSKVMTRAIMAKGGTIYEPTWALIGEAGYNETVIPNTPWGVRPLASMIAEEMGNTKSSGVVVTGNTFVVRNDQDITRVANQLNNMISRQTGGRL